MEQIINGANTGEPMETPVKEITSVQKEKRYNNIQKLIKSTRCIVQLELKLYVYDMIIKRLTRLGDYRDCVELVEKYSKIREKTEWEGKEEIYQHMLTLQENVTKAEDIQWVRKEAERIPDYKDTQEVLQWCDRKFAEMEKQEQNKAIVRLTIFIILLIVFIIAAKYGISLLR